MGFCYGRDMNAKHDHPYDEPPRPDGPCGPGHRRPLGSLPVERLSADTSLQQILDAPPASQHDQLELRPRLYLLVAPHRALSGMIAAAAARLSLQGPVRVLDGGDLYDAHAVARLVRVFTPRLDETLAHIKIARAFTCYQVEALLAAQQPGPDPLLGLDLLDAFADENVPLAHRDYLAQQMVHRLLQLARCSITLVGVAPAADPPLNSYIFWLAQAAQRVLRLEDPQPPRQWRLF